MTETPTAVVLTVGNELLSGDVEDTNAPWLCRRLSGLGVEVKLVASVRDDIEEIAAFLCAERPRADYVFVTGGLGGTPDDITREAVATAFSVRCEEIAEVAAVLRARFEPRGLGDYAARWAQLPAGSEPISNPLGGAPGFSLENVYVFPGLPAEMEAMFLAIEEEFRRGSPIESWRRIYQTYESRISASLAEAGERWPGVLVGSYPSFGAGGFTVEVVLKSSDSAALEEASAWLAAAIEESS
jgi:molybdenum cofactor synthesis domain-containing protein